MYFVDREHIERMLKYLENSLAMVKSQNAWTTNIEKRALERLVHMMIESMVDIGNAMIDGFIMRDPGSFEDIIVILEDERVITSKRATGLKRVIELRKVLVQQYLDVDHSTLIDIIKKEEEHLQAFPDEVRTYLEDELGPVSAFRN
ncbi:type VII toxin-antitoxin system HepT family RNase toxin [Litchfieldia salsa]|uniref:Uncharacterized conserved protein YutE, UPF0331/DUF86 family n=1 Tax=Litchfieldia salsa TaxID=930152 RepID=A0A1H0WQ83_9BACI|nr:DUF86 domain-containing protein [Litchfieldia salsa]SDP92834.1 Uncharacterized conserved protein YutE, UPF0331/DUF86 family [Litchfieldia salsa]